MGADLIRGLHFIHSRGIIMADITPTNILVNEYGTLKVGFHCLRYSHVTSNQLGSFQYARRIEDIEFEKPRVKLGTTAFMAPELFDEMSVHSFASDLWTLVSVKVRNEHALSHRLPIGMFVVLFIHWFPAICG